MGVNCLGDKLLSRAALALHQNGRATGSNLSDQIEHSLHGLTFSDDILEAIALLQGALQVDVFRFRAMLSNGCTDVRQKLLVVPGFLNEIIRAMLHGLDDV